ncbi:MAG: pitrilysin family protein [Armatimonadaceae bacterium]
MKRTRSLVDTLAVTLLKLTSVLVFHPLPVYAQPVQPEGTVLVAEDEPGKPIVSRLASGLRIVTVPVPDADTVAVEVFFQVGLVDQKNQSGINALLTRAWGQDTESRYGPLLRNDVARIGSVGTDLSEDWVELWGVCAASPVEVEKLLQTLLTNIVANARFDAETVQKARQEQIDVVQMQRDDLMADVIERLRGRIYGNSAYGLPLLGSTETLTSLTAENITRHYQTYFQPERCVVVLAGPMHSDTTRRLVEVSLGAGGWKPAPERPRPAAYTPEAVPEGLRPLRVARPAPAGVYAQGFLVPGTAASGSRKQFASLLLLDAVLSGGKAGRLFRTLRDSGSGKPAIGYDVATQIQSGRGQSLWLFLATGIGSETACREALQGELEALASGARPVTAEERERAVAFLKGRHQLRRQRLKDRAFGVGWSEVMGLGADFDTRYGEMLESVSLEELNRFARSVLNQASAVAYSPAIPSSP